MEEFIFNVFGNVANLIQFVVWLVCLVVFIVSLIVKRNKSKIIDNEMMEIDMNKKNQEKEEENMAKMFFLCDRCGKTVNAENGVKLTHNGNGYDFCETCGKIIKAKLDEKSRAEINFINAENVYNNAKSKLNGVNSEFEKLFKKEETKEEQKNSTDDIRTKLGI